MYKYNIDVRVWDCESGDWLEEPEEYTIGQLNGMNVQIEPLAHTNTKTGAKIYDGDKVIIPARRDIYEDWVYVVTTMAGIVRCKNSHFYIEQTKSGLSISYDKPNSKYLKSLQDEYPDEDYSKGRFSVLEKDFYGPEGPEFSWDNLVVVGNIHEGVKK